MTPVLLSVVVMLWAQTGVTFEPPPPALTTMPLYVPEEAPPPEPEPEPEPATAAVVTSLRLSLSAPREGELERLEGYLRDVLHKPANLATVADVVARIDRLERYKKPLCRIEHTSFDKAVLSCTLRRTRVVRQVIVETRDVLNLDGVNTGLPLAILENDLKKRILLRTGEPLDDESNGRNRIQRQRQRIEDFLDREGYFGAQVKIDTVRVGDEDEQSENNEVDVVIRVLGGSFVKVRRVNIVDFGPISQRRLNEAFGNMCLNGEGFLDGFFVGNITSCFNRLRLQSTINRFTTELHDLGFPEGRLRVTTSFVDPRSRQSDARTLRDEGCTLGLDDVKALSKQKLPLPPKCIDLNVEVIPGNQVVTRFHLEEANQPLVDQPAFLEGTARFARETFTEPLSRLWQTTFDNPVETASDTVVITDDLEKRLTFNESGSVDEAEARMSKERIEAYLAERGYSAPDVALVFQEYGDGSVAIDYTIKPGTPVPVADVRILGNSSIPAEEIFDEVEFAARPRNLQSAGFLGKTALDDDVLRLRAFYGARGFPEAEVRVHAVRDHAGKVHVIFIVDEGEHFAINAVVFAGGDPAMTKDVLAALAHCRAGVADAEQRKPVTGDDCRGNPLLPDEMDADARRVEAVYSASGYPAVEAAVELGFSDAGPLVRVSVFPLGAIGDARSAPQAGNVRPLLMGQIFVEGNIETRREVLLREMGVDNIVPGTRLDPQRIAAGVARLRRTGLFSRVDAELLLPPTDPKKKPEPTTTNQAPQSAHVRISVEERPSTTVDVSMGVSTEQLFSLRLEGRNKNLFGTMFDGSAALDLGLFIGRFSQVRTQVRWPRLLGTDISLSFSPLSSTYKDEPAGFRLSTPASQAGQRAALSWEKPDDRRRLFTLGSSVSLDWRANGISPSIDDKLTVGIALEARGDWLDVKGQYFSPLSQEALTSVDGLLNLLEKKDPVPVIALTPRVAWADIDNPFDPKRGTSANLFVRTVPFALAPYVVLGTSARGYGSIIDDRVTFAGGLRLRWGIAGQSQGHCINGERCEWALMQNDLLRLGGERSVRGVDENSVGESSTIYDQSLVPVTINGGEPSIGVRPGLFGAVANFEVRFSVIPHLFIGELKPAVFTDLGVSTDDLNFRTPAIADGVLDSRYAFSVGAGIRYVLPVGPLAVDFAYSPFDAASAGLPVRVYVLLGYIF